MTPERHGATRDRGRPRMLVVAHELAATGAPRVLLETCRELALEYELWMIARHGGRLQSQFGRIAEITILGPRSRPLAGATSAALASELAGALIRRETTSLRARMWRPSMIYVNSTHGLPIAAKLRLRHVPILLHVHEAAVGLADLEEQHPHLIASLPTRYIAVSQSVADELVETYGVSRSRIGVVPPFVDVPTTPRRRAGESTASDEDAPTFVVGGIGNPSWFKGLELWLLCARRVADALGAGRVQFTWVGVRDNSEARHLRAMIAKLDLGGVIELREEVSDVSDELTRFDLLALTSWEESASLATLEAMAHGVPVVCFAGSGGPPELLGDTGEIVDEYSPGAMAQAIVQLLRDPVRREALAAAARDRASRRYSRSSVMPNFLQESRLAAD